MLSKFCRKCKGNHAEEQRSRSLFLVGVALILEQLMHLFPLTYRWKTGILEPPSSLFQEFSLSDEKLAPIAHASSTSRSGARPALYEWIALL